MFNNKSAALVASLAMLLGACSSTSVAPSAGQFDGQGDHHTPASYVEKAFRKYLECGPSASSGQAEFVHGFARARCDDCGDDFLVAFSCKGRGICPRVQHPAHGRGRRPPVRPRVSPPAGAPVGAVGPQTPALLFAARQGARSMRRCISSFAWCAQACRPIAPPLQMLTPPACGSRNCASLVFMCVWLMGCLRRCQKVLRLYRTGR